MTEVLLQLVDRYPSIPPIHVTENGCSYGMEPDGQGIVDDEPRIRYYVGHLAAVASAIEQGAPVAGYFAWSLLDNFEWAEGFTQRFGLVHVDYETQKRTPKASYYWFQSLIQAQQR